MESLPVDWPELADGTGVDPGHDRPAHDLGKTCHGLWCFKQDAGHDGGLPDPNPAPPPETPADPIDDATGGPPQAPGAPISGLAVPPADPASGVTLCFIASTNQPQSPFLFFSSGPPGSSDRQLVLLGK